ncbi:tetratricopeptide repeat protein [Fodinicola feengrottensis]|uniref:tetratricopeptide repeat protein n=1 Tax=Fodinicola feengrottensis TaxID=435914 RepID=UPI0013D101F0|nr:tetratricopeptide repeat protein [Fodinicola feengrottensis]
MTHTSADLDPAIRSQLSSLAKESAETVARHLVAAGQLVDTDPAAAYAHAAAARAYGGRIGVVREAVGLAAYFAGNWMTSLAELRSYRRMTGSVEHFATEADCERAMGRPEKAIKMLRAPEVVAQLDVDGKAELLIVVAGARRDLGDAEAAVAMLVNEAKSARPGRPSTVRLWYAYADMLLAAGRADEARKWFALASHADEDGETDDAARGCCPWTASKSKRPNSRTTKLRTTKLRTTKLRTTRPKIAMIRTAMTRTRTKIRATTKTKEMTKTRVMTARRS